MSTAASPTPQSQPPPAPEKNQFLLDLGNGLQLWKVPLSLLREQDENARVMSKPMFERLTMTVRRDKRLESFPLCAQTAKGLEIVSGHHRVRAATAAQVADIYVIVDVTGLTQDQIRAKQLAHNSIAGVDDEQILARIYSQITDADAKLEAFIDQKFESEIPQVGVESLSTDVDYRVVGLTFLPTEKAQFEKIADELIKMFPSIYVAEMSQFDPFRTIIKRVAKEYDIRSIATVLTKMSEIVADHLGIEQDQESEIVSLRDLFGTNVIPATAAATIKQALKKMRKADELTDKNTWQALEYWAADYNAGK